MSTKIEMIAFPSEDAERDFRFKQALDREEAQLKREIRNAEQIERIEKLRRKARGKHGRALAFAQAAKGK